MAPPATIRAHPPPSSESTTTTTSPEQQPPPSPPTPPSGVESEAPPKRRKVEEVGFQRSPYYTIRETVANLRGRFLQVCQGTDSEKKDAAVEILKEMKDVMELSKKTRLDLSSAAEPVKPLDKPADGVPKDKHAGKVQSSEKSQVPPTSLAGNVVPGGDVPLKPGTQTLQHIGYWWRRKRGVDQVTQQIIRSSRVDSREGLMPSVDLPLAGIFSCGLDAKQSTTV